MKGRHEVELFSDSVDFLLFSPFLALASKTTSTSTSTSHQHNRQQLLISQSKRQKAKGNTGRHQRRFKEKEGMIRLGIFEPACIVITLHRHLTSLTQGLPHQSAWYFSYRTGHQASILSFTNTIILKRRRNS